MFNKQSIKLRQITKTILKNSFKTKYNLIKLLMFKYHEINLSRGK